MEFQIWFNLEFIEVLRYTHGILGKKILFVTDSLIKAKWANILYDVNVRIVPSITSIIETEGRTMPKSNKLIVIGNPPYNANSNSRDSKPIYNRFIETIIDYIRPAKLSMIVPSRWMVGGKGLDKFRNRMMLDRRFKICRDFKNSHDIFPRVDIPGGVNYFLWDSSHSGPCDFNGISRYIGEYDIVVRDNCARSIINKIKTSCSKYIIDNVSTSKPYNIRTSEPIVETGILCFYNQSIGKKNVSEKSVIDKQKNLNLWKVIVPIAPIAGQTNFNKPISIFNNGNISILPPMEICSETYIVLNSFNTENECFNFISYIKTKFFRFMLLQRIDSQNVSRDCYAWIPDQIDYSRSYSDEYLYAKYSLTKEEIDNIDGKIKDIAAS